MPFENQHTPSMRAVRRRPERAFALFVPAASALALALAMPAVAQDKPLPEPEVWRGAEVVDVATPVLVERDLRELPRAPRWEPGDPIKEIPRRHPRPALFGEGVAPAHPTAWKRDVLLDAQARATAGPGSRAFSTPDLNLAGQGFTGVNPPDTVGDVGAAYYIQMINASGGAVFRVHDKNTGAVVAGPTLLDSLGSSFCANGLGDPVVLYDHLAGRWLLSEFSSSGNRLCVYVSKTGDPISGGWWAYSFSATNFPDYPKYAVWPDAYYVGTNENSPAAYALQRSQMLLGAPAAMQRFTAPALGGFGFQMITPSDLDGAAPPAGAPATFLRHRDDESHNPGSNDPTRDFLEIFEFHVDFATPANSTFTGPFTVPVAEFDSNLCGLTSFSCISQPGTSVRLDPLREVVMWRSQYRNFGSYQVLVGNLATDVDNTDHAGVRWYELRKSGAGPWTLFQQGTYAPDGNSRWMGSAAMDSAGNIAVGWNVSSAATFPGLRYAGRLAADPAGTLPQGENVLINGTASNASNRYGDYASMNVDPIDGCTFWFTGEYNAASQWSTRIGRFRFNACAGTCGNNVKEPGEVCDGTDLGGATCTSQGCGGGTLACNSTCNGFDLTGCSGCPVCNNNGTCEAGEDCLSCPNDCVSGSTPGAVCGNGVCEAGDGENCVTCAADCNGTQSGKPANRFCCGFGGTNPVGCSDTRCTSGGFNCTTTPQPSSSFCCGDFACSQGESCANCALDCTLGSEICTGGVDEDCNGLVDCADAQCATNPACVCGNRGAPCTSGSQCCSGVCKSNGTCR